MVLGDRARTGGTRLTFMDEAIALARNGRTGQYRRTASRAGICAISISILFNRGESLRLLGDARPGHGAGLGIIARAPIAVARRDAHLRQRLGSPWDNERSGA